MLSAYLPLLRIPGARQFMLGSALARLGGAMFGVAVVAMVSDRRDSYGLAGAVSAVGLVVLAVSVAIVGRMIDRYGQRRTALPLILWSAFWATLVVIVSLADGPTWMLFVTYGCAAIIASAGTMSRARWSHIFRDDPKLLNTAMSFEQVVDELGFVAGPAIAVLLATQTFPEAGFIAAAVCYGSGSLLFLAARSTEPPVHPDAHMAGSSVLLRPAILVLVFVMFMTGAIFGSNEVVTIAVAERLGNKGAAGIILAVYALGSAGAGLLYGTLNIAPRLSTQLVVGTAAMFLLEIPVLIAHDLLPLGVVMLIAGMATAPTLIVSMNMSQQLVPPSRVNESMGVVLTALIIGVAGGSAVSGYVAEEYGAHQGFWVPVVAAGLAAVLALLARPTLRRSPAVFGAPIG